MKIWLSLLIPFIAVLVLALRFRRKMTWWEYLIVFGIPCILVVVCKILAVEWQSDTKEWWNSYVTGAAYYEDWDEWVVQTCYREVSCGKNCTTMVPYDCSHSVYHPACWELTDNLGSTYHVNSDYYAYLVKLWGNQAFKDLNRSYYTNDGDEYYTRYDDIFDHSIPLVTQHHYENRVRSSRSVFNFQEVALEDVKKFGLYDYPKYSGVFDYNPILGQGGPSPASVRLQRYNGQLGACKRVHMLILVFAGQPLQAGFMQEAYWKGGNKNEFILCIGTQGKKITWTKVISWTDVGALKACVARRVREMDSLDMAGVVDLVASEVKAKFVKKNFRDFDYITVEPTDRAVMITFILTFLATVGLGIYCVFNDRDF